MNVIFLGTPEFAIPSLEVLLKTTWLKVLAVCTQTDKEAGRGKKIKEPPVKSFALKNGLIVFQTKKISKESEIIQKIKKLKPDIMISCAYGQILSQEILDTAPLGVINIHASLLPKYRGAAPINWAIINGEKETGITIMKTELGLDTGPIILQEKCEINENETANELSHKLSHIGATALLKAFELIKNGHIKYTPQDENLSTKAPILKKEQGLINWNKTTKEIHNQVRGLQPWPSAFTHYNGKMVKVWESRIDETATGQNSKEAKSFCPGEIIEIRDYVKVKTNNGYLDIYKLQPENKNIIKAKDWVNGARVRVGNRFE